MLEILLSIRSTRERIEFVLQYLRHEPESRSAPATATSSKSEWAPAHEHDVPQFFKDLPQKYMEWEVEMVKSCFEDNIPHGSLFWGFAWARGGHTLLDLTGDWCEDPGQRRARLFPS